MDDSDLTLESMPEEIVINHQLSLVYVLTVGRSDLVMLEDRSAWSCEH